MPRGLVYVHEGFVWFLEGATCAMAALRVIPTSAIRVAGFGNGLTPELDVGLDPLRKAVDDPGSDAAPPRLQYEIEGKAERRSIARYKGSSSRAQAVFFSVVHALRPCEVKQSGRLPAVPAPPEDEGPALT